MSDEGKIEYREAEQHASHAASAVDALNEGYYGADPLPVRVVGSVSALRDNEIKLEFGESGEVALWLKAAQCERIAQGFDELAKYLRTRKAVP